MQEELQSVKNLCHGLRMQMHYLLTERRGGGNEATTATAPVTRTTGLIRSNNNVNVSIKGNNNNNNNTKATNGHFKSLQKLGSMGTDLPRQEKL
ncbi:hypothetical protein Glove_294g51 [Diversispora epigaea]|nr:hypothetical protein Glove_294g51 [Diversispora epigaea]